jgi:hypothetical protein
MTQSVEDHTQHDYRRTVEEIYIEAAVWALCQRDHPSPLAVLSMAGIGLRRSLSLPSWVPDLTLGSDLELEFMLPTPIGFWEYRENGYMASGDTDEDSEISASYRLSIKAIRVDEIRDLIVLESVHSQYPGIDLDLEDYVLAATCLFSLSKYAQHPDGLEILWRSIASEVASGTPSTRDDISEFIWCCNLREEFRESLDAKYGNWRETTDAQRWDLLKDFVVVAATVAEDIMETVQQKMIDKDGIETMQRKKTRGGRVEIAQPEFSAKNDTETALQQEMTKGDYAETAQLETDEEPHTKAVLQDEMKGCRIEISQLKDIGILPKPLLD